MLFGCKDRILSKRMNMNMNVALHVTLYTRLNPPLHFSLSTGHRMLKHDFDYHPYKTANCSRVERNQLSPTERFLQTLFAFAITERLETFFTDEAHFELNGCVNRTCATGWLIIQIGRLQNHCILQCGAPFHSTASPDLFFLRTNSDTLFVGSKVRSLSVQISLTIHLCYYDKCTAVFLVFSHVFLLKFYEFAHRKIKFPNGIIFVECFRGFS